MSKNQVFKEFSNLNDCTIYRYTQGEKESTINTISVFNGINIILMNLNSCNIAPDISMYKPNNILLINLCIFGRCEMTLRNNQKTSLNADEISFNITYPSKCNYPFGYYKEIGLLIDFNSLDIDTKKMLSRFNINLEKIQKYIINQNGYKIYNIGKNQKLKSIIKTLTLQNDLIEYRLSTLKILYNISKYIDIFISSEQAYLPSLKIDIVQKVRLKICGDLKKHYSTKDLSNEFNISSSTLERYFKAVYGISISKFLQKERMNVASNLLKDTTMKISDIAYSVGYENQSKFTATFKKTFGETPNNFRKFNRHILNAN